MLLHLNPFLLQSEQKKFVLSSVCLSVVFMSSRTHFYSSSCRESSLRIIWEDAQLLIFWDWRCCVSLGGLVYLGLWFHSGGGRRATGVILILQVWERLQLISHGKIDAVSYQTWVNISTQWTATHQQQQQRWPHFLGYFHFYWLNSFWHSWITKTFRKCGSFSSHLFWRMFLCPLNGENTTNTHAMKGLS